MVDWRGVTPQPPAATPSAATRRGDRGSWESSDDAERGWLIYSRRPARRRTALLVGLAVVAAVIVSVLAYRRFQR
jgi:hypothetical protein